MNECVLVVDDDAEIVKAIAILLEKEGGHLCVLIHNNISYLFSIIWKKQGAPRCIAPRRSLLCRLPAMVRSSQQQLLPQPQLLPPALPFPQQQQSRMMIRMIHRQLPPPKPQPLLHPIMKYLLV